MMSDLDLIQSTEGLVFCTHRLPIAWAMLGNETWMLTHVWGDIMGFLIPSIAYRWSLTSVNCHIYKGRRNDSETVAEPTPLPPQWLKLRGSATVHSIF